MRLAVSGTWSIFLFVLGALGKREVGDASHKSHTRPIKTIVVEPSDAIYSDFEHPSDSQHQLEEVSKRRNQSGMRSVIASEKEEQVYAVSTGVQLHEISDAVDGGSKLRKADVHIDIVSDNSTGGHLHELSGAGVRASKRKKAGVYVDTARKNMEQVYLGVTGNDANFNSESTNERITSSIETQLVAPVSKIDPSHSSTYSMIEINSTSSIQTQHRSPLPQIESLRALGRSVMEAVHEVVLKVRTRDLNVEMASLLLWVLLVAAFFWWVNRSREMLVESLWKCRWFISHLCKECLSVFVRHKPQISNRPQIPPRPQTSKVRRTGIASHLIQDYERRKSKKSKKSKSDDISTDGTVTEEECRDEKQKKTSRSSPCSEPMTS